MAHVNEYDPMSRDQTRGIQTDPRKLKFNNIQSCIAVVLCVYNTGTGLPVINRLIGAHINTINLDNNELELNIAISQLKQAANTVLDIYLVGPYDAQYATSRLRGKLMYLNPRSMKLLNFSPVIAGSGANKDVKVEVAGAGVNIYYRDCVVWDRNTLKDKYNPALGNPSFGMTDLNQGHHSYVNDKALKPWQPATIFRVLV